MVQKYEACTTETCLWILTGEDITTVRKKYPQALDKGHIVQQGGISRLQRICWAAA
jgi:hypothetical protein